MTDFLCDVERLGEQVGSIDANEAIERHRQGGYCFVDLRDGLELQQYGLIPGAQHCPRGSLEFRIAKNSSYHQAYFSYSSHFVFYCSHGQRSILATQTAQTMGLAKVCHMKGGMRAWVKAGGLVVPFGGDL